MNYVIDNEGKLVLLNKKLEPDEPFQQKKVKKSFVKTFNSEQYEGLNLGRITYRYKGENYGLLEGKTFFIIRHAQGIHNVNKTDKWLNSSRYLDAPLTEDGKNQAYTAGVKLKNWLDTRKMQLLPSEIAMFFVSDLERTHQTCREILQVLYPESPEKRMMYVLPCLHELNSGCDKDMKNMVKMSENQIRCNPLTDNGCDATEDVVWDFNKYEINQPDHRTDRLEYRDKEFCTTLNVFEQAVLKKNESENLIEHYYLNLQERGGKSEIQKEWSDYVKKFPYAYVLFQRKQNKEGFHSDPLPTVFTGSTRRGGRRKTRHSKRKRTRRK